MNEGLERHSKRVAQDRADGVKNPHDLVERWEIEQMIATGFQEGLERYEARVVQPRYMETKSCLTLMNEKLDGLKSTADRQAGATELLKWVLGGGGLLGFLSLLLGFLVYLKH